MNKGFYCILIMTWASANLFDSCMKIVELRQTDQVLVTYVYGLCALVMAPIIVIATIDWLKEIEK